MKKSPSIQTDFFKIKIKCYRTVEEMNVIQNGIRPDCIIYTGSVAANCRLYGVKLKKWHKAISKVIGKYEAEIPSDLHCIIYIKCNMKHFETTHAIGTEGEHTVFHEEIFNKSLNNFKEFTFAGREGI